MSQKSSVPQAISFVSQVLKRDSKDVFVHISAVERAGLSGLNEGQAIEYEEVSDRGKTSAGNLKVRR